MTTTVENATQSDMRVLDTVPSTQTGTIPTMGQFVCLFHDGVVSAGWLMEEPREQEPDPTGQVYFEAQLLTADGVVVFVRRTRQEWLDAERDERTPDVRTLLSVQRRRKAELNAIVMAAHEYADDNDLCERFDEFLDEHGLPSRNERTQEVEVMVTVRLTVYTKGRNESEAYEQMEHEEVVAALSETIAGNPSAIDYERD